MTVMEFVSSMASALAWPVVAVVAVMFFGRDVRRWLKERPTKVKFGPVEAEWMRQAAITEAKLDSPEAQVTAGRRDGHTDSLANALKPEATGEPLVAVLRASSAVEDSLRTKLAQAGAQDFGQLGLTGLASLANRQGLISGRTADALDGLAVMRNLAAHSGAPSVDQAKEFVALADAVVYAVDRS